MALTATVITILEKTAFDSGFDLELGRQGDWLRYGHWRRSAPDPFGAA